MARLLTLAVLSFAAVSSVAQAQTPTPTPRPGLTGAAAKAAVKCEKALTQAAATFVAKKQGSLKKCIDVVYGCVQLKPSDAKCFPKARATCDKEFAKIGAAEAKLIDAVTAKCTSDALSSTDLLDELGLGFGLATFSATCAALGVTVADLADVAECISKQQECAVEDLLAGRTPLAAYLLGLVGREARSAFCPLPTPCATTTPESTPSPTVTPSETSTAETVTPTSSATGATPEATPTAAESPSSTPALTPAETVTPVETVTPMETATSTPVDTGTPSETPTDVPTPSETPTDVPTPSETPTPP